MPDPDDGRDASGESLRDRGADELVAERLPPDEAFELVAHETRFRVLETLVGVEDPLAFGDLRERVGVDDPGQFNYHLRKLTGRFVRSDGDGYELAPAGRRVVGAVLSGGYTKALDADPVATDATCLVCGSEMETRFRDDKIEIRCRECDSNYTNTPIPAGIFEGVAPEDAPAVVDRWLKRIHSTADYGFCHNCDGSLTVTVVVEGDEKAPDGLGEDGVEAAVCYECDRCGFDWYSSFPFVATLHPAVVGFHHERGIDVRTTPFWELDWIEMDAAAVETRDPLRVEVSVTLDDETRVFAFDADLNVVEERRE